MAFAMESSVFGIQSGGGSNLACLLVWGFREAPGAEIVQPLTLGQRPKNASLWETGSIPGFKLNWPGLGGLGSCHQRVGEGSQVVKGLPTALTMEDSILRRLLGPLGFSTSGAPELVFWNYSHTLPLWTCNLVSGDVPARLMWSVSGAGTVGTSRGLTLLLPRP